MSTIPPSLRFQARRLYKELHVIARDYPDKAYPIHERLHQCFLAHVGKDEEGVQKGIEKAEFIKKELEALYFLKKYRSMKERYYP